MQISAFNQEGPCLDPQFACLTEMLLSAIHLDDTLRQPCRADLSHVVPLTYLRCLRQGGQEAIGAIARLMGEVAKSPQRRRTSKAANRRVPRQLQFDMLPPQEPARNRAGALDQAESYLNLFGKAMSAQNVN